jgi:small-conductance mechanosensitive channel
MQDAGFWNTAFWGNTITDWVIAGAIIVAVLVVLRIVAAVIANRLKRLASVTQTDIDDLAADILDRTKLLFVLIVAVWSASLTLTLSEAAESRIRAVLIIGMLLQAAFWATALMNYFLERYRRRALDEDPSVATALGAVGFLLRATVWGITVMVALDTLGVDITALVAGLGVGGIAIALALQSVLGDLFASISIVLDKPFVVGDFIIVGDATGTVENVGLKTTRIRSISGEQLVVANSDLLSSRIRNYKRMQERRVLFEVGLVYGTEAAMLKTIPETIRAAVESRDNTRFDRSHFKAFGASALIFETVYFMTVPDYNAYMDTQQGINLELYERFEADGLEFAFPTQTIFMHSQNAEPVAAT